jgi:hypothetical protein
MVNRDINCFFPQWAMQKSGKMATWDSEVNLPAKAKPLTLYSGRYQYKQMYNINYTSNSHVNLIHNTIYAFVLTYLWEWQFIAETCRKVEVYVQYIILLCAYVDVYKGLQTQCMKWIILNH